MKIEIDETGKWQNSFTIKMVLLAITGLFLLVPLELIKQIMRERQQNSDDCIFDCFGSDYRSVVILSEGHT